MSSLDDLGLDRNLYKAPLDGTTWDADTIADNLEQVSLDNTAVMTGGAAADINNGSVTVDGSQLTPGSAIPQSAFDIANLGWVQTPTFSASSATVVAWTSGTFTAADGTSYSIASGNTGTMAAITYIYLNTAVSTTQYQVTTNQADVIGPNRVLIAVAQNQTSTATFNTVQTALITANNIFVNSLSAISANLGTITAGSININNLSFIGSDGYATFIGVSTLNMKAYTNFETAGRFVLNGVVPTFSNNGMMVAPGSSPTHYSQCLWFVNEYILRSYPTFTCSLLCGNLNVAIGDGHAVIGLGYVTISGTDLTFGDSHNFCGFEFSKNAGVCNLNAVQQDGTGATRSATLTTLSNGDYLELFLKVTSSGVNYYYRKNGGNITGPTTVTTNVPSGNEQYISFESTNQGGSVDFQLQLQCAAYEH